MLLLVDNHDSFTFNLAQYLGELGAAVRVVFSDAISVEEVVRLAPSHVVLSPGPGTPARAGISVELVRALAGRVPLLGVCLGQQAIAEAFGGRVVRARRAIHGKVGPVRHDGRGLFVELPPTIAATRYHSLVVERASLPAELEETAWAPDGEDDGEALMGLRHRRHAIEALQFHPESIGTPDGKRLLARFLAMQS